MQREGWKERIKVKESKKDNLKKTYEIGTNPFDADYLLLMQENRKKEKSEGR